ncbi:MAG: adenylate/guanylate cyclase domain-containing protein, partial [Elusimicrobia bacterium]|nr:adenylate/guanylate cyclase domain-containing protein [Elusimicrobiota bacterium]
MTPFARRARALLAPAALLAVVGAAVLAAARTSAGRELELKTLDWRQRACAEPSRADRDLVLVMLDQASLDHFEKDGIYWPWPRSLYGAALKFLKKGGARAVVFDDLFTSPSPYGEDQDADFGRSIRAFGPVALAMETGPEPEAARAAAPPARFAAVAPALAASARRASSVRLPVPELLGGARWLGDASQEPDADGVFRRVPLAVSMGGRLYPSLAAAAAMAATGKPLSAFRPALVGGEMPVLFRGKAETRDPRLKTYDWYSLGDLILGEQALEDGRRPALDPALFKGKTVLVGMSAAGLMDNHPSPVAGVFPGTEIVAAAADNLIRGDSLRPAPAAVLPLLVLAALLAAWLSTRLTVRAWAPAAACAAASAALAGAAVLAFRRGVWLDLAAPQLALWLGFAAASAWSYAVEGRRKRYLQAAFAHYLSPEVVRRIAESPEALALGGERRDATFYFSDIEGFTTISEGLAPDALARLMNRFLGAMTDEILASGGTLDKYIGDAVMAFWGAPIARADHARTACRVALANQRRLAELREEFAREGLPPVRSRIGLNSGPASIGNMGSSRRFSYTALGDAVNLASRLEGANKAYGTYLLISESTREQAGDAIEVRELDFVKVKGKNL